MIEKKGRKLYRMFTKWCLSYVVISIVALIVIFFCSTRYSQALHEDLEYTNAVQLELVQLQMDRSVRNLRAFSSRANQNKTVNSLRQLDSYEDVSRYELYELVRDLANEMLYDGGLHDCYLYFPNSDLLVSGNYYNDSREFYDIAFESYGFSYEDWFEVISQGYRTAQIFSLDTKKGDQLTVLLKPLDSSNRQQPPVNAIMVMDIKEILKASDWLNQDRDNMCIIDRTNKRVVSTAKLDESVEEYILSHVLAAGSGEFQNQFEMGESVISYISSQYEKWEYLVITKEQQFVSQISEIQRLVWGLIAVYLLISAGSIGYAVIRHYRPLQDVMNILEQQEEGADNSVGDDAYQYISKSIHKLVDKNKESSSVISRQRNAISRELFHRLLTEKKAYAMMDEELLGTYGIQVNGKEYCILSYRLEETLEYGAEETPADTREMSWFILQNVTEENLGEMGLKWICFREGRWEQVFLIWKEETDPSSESLHSLVYQAWSLSTEFIQSHFKFPYQSALSEPHHGTEEIWQAYRETGRVFEYQKNDEGKQVVSYREINLLPVDTMLKYPIDVENRLSHSVSNGDAEEACREIRLLLEENQANCLAPEVMQFLVSNIASSILRVAGKAAKGTALHISQKALMEACRQGESARMQEELERLVVAVCQEIEELNKKEKENQKSRLYQEAKAYVENNYSDPELSVNSMAEQLGVQPTYLSKLFKEMEGEKLSQYISMVRLTHVKEMLLEDVSDIRLETIAARCGFGSQRTFLRIFKQYEGLTPTQFRELEEKKEKRNEDS